MSLPLLKKYRAKFENEKGIENDIYSSLQSLETDPNKKINVFKGYLTEEFRLKKFVPKKLTKVIITSKRRRDPLKERFSERKLKSIKKNLTSIFPEIEFTVIPPKVKK